MDVGRKVDCGVLIVYYDVLKLVYKTNYRQQMSKSDGNLKKKPVVQTEESAFDCSKYNKREGQSCDLNNNCKYPNCTAYPLNVYYPEQNPNKRLLS
jgi:hypothetical protein